MKWIPCPTDNDLLGESEGHCATTLTAVDGGVDADTYVVVLGGYHDGELRGNPLVTSATALPILSWTELAYHEHAECDGATLTAVRPSEALLFGGLDADMDRRNRTFSVQLTVSSEGQLAMQCVELTGVTGSVPSPRSRHGAGFSEGQLFIMGGETDAEEQCSDVYCLQVDNLVWRRIIFPAGSPTPAPRLMSVPLVSLQPHAFVVYGGCYYNARAEVVSLSDAWVCEPDAPRWRAIACGADSLPECNGHAGGRLNATTAVFLGGKDISTGDDRVKIVTYDGASGTYQSAMACPVVEAGVDGPHWRYAAVAVETPNSLMLIGGQCRHPQRPSVFLLRD